MSLLILSPLLTIFFVLTKTWHLLHLAKQMSGPDEEDKELFLLMEGKSDVGQDLGVSPFWEKKKISAGRRSG